MSYIQFDSYDNDTHSEDGLLTRDEMIEREQFTFTDGSPVILDPDGIICHEEAQEMATNAPLSTLKDYVAPHAGSVIAGVIIGIAIGASFWFTNAELAWRN